ncbi:MAG: recombination protein RecR [Ruminococcaceae bacterium]|nr:recombination protein RecR [Oscillospiraceae bacterium]
MSTLPSLEILIEQFRRLPSVGRRSAERMAYAILDYSKEEANFFANAIIEAKENIKRCKVCHNFSEDEICPVCSDESRDHSVICVVEDARDIISLEKVKDYLGVYHVIGGTISPMKGVSPEDLNIKSLMYRLSNDDISEIIIATNPTVEGETTALYISRLVKPLGIKVTRLAYGMPVGGELDHADEVTIGRAIEGRKEL